MITSFIMRDIPAREGAMTPPDQLPPTARCDTRQPLTPSIDSLEPLERRVTIYTRGLVWDQIQATWVRVYQIVDRYIRSLPAADIILDLRGHIVATGRKWS
jgi:hypothetical protein